MKRLIYVLGILLALSVGACGGSKVDKAAMLQKLKSNAELTQDDYSALINILEEDCAEVLKWHDAHPDVKWADTPAEIKEQSEDVFLVGIELQNAAGKDKLDSANMRRFVKVLDKASEVAKR